MDSRGAFYLENSNQRLSRTGEHTSSVYTRSWPLTKLSRSGTLINMVITLSKAIL
jgi:hypothetical protein